MDNCPHACVARPCGALAKCVPNLENYECECNPSNEQCNKAEEVSAEELSEEIAMAGHAYSTETTLTFDNDEEEGDDDEADNDPSDNGGDDYYYEYDEDDTATVGSTDLGGDGDTQKIIVRVEKTTSKRPLTLSTTTTTTTSTTVRPVVSTTMTPPAKPDPYKDLIEDIESHYILRGRYMSEQQNSLHNGKTVCFFTGLQVKSIEKSKKLS